MSVLALGLNHHTAPVAIRERISISEDRLADALRALKDVEAVNEAAIVSTCNRTEIYCGSGGQAEAHLLEWLRSYLGIADAQLSDYLFMHSEREAVHHLMRVCSGLDSMIIGEPQILGQMKRAYREATAAGTVGAELSPLFEAAFSVAKRVRTDTEIGSSPVSVAFAAVSLARQIFAGLESHTALLIGAGETVQLAARHLKSHGVGKTLIANRTVERARSLADEVGGTALSLSEIPDILAQADIIVSSTASPLPILGKGMVGRALKTRRFRPVLIVDIAVPRDVEAEVSDIDNVFLYTVDDLQEVIEENRQSRRAAADQAEQIIQDQVELYMRRLRSMGATHSIRAFRDSVTGIANTQLERSRKQLQRGADPEQVLEQLVHGLSNKFMHLPTSRLRDAAEQGDTDLIDAAHTLFDIPARRQ